MSTGINQGGYRSVQINFGTAASSVITVPAAPVDFYKAVTHWVAANEFAYNTQPTGTITNLAAVTVLITGKHPTDIYKATVTVTISTGVYNFTFVKAGQTVEDLA